MSVTVEQPRPQGKIAKGITERRIIEALSPGWRLVRINWKKRKIHIVNSFGNVKVISLGSVSQ